MWRLMDERMANPKISRALALYYGKSEEPLLHVEPDAIWPGMFRVRTSSGVSDMVNLTRAKDAAVTIALRDLNSQAQEKPSEGRHIRLWAAPLGGPPLDRNRIAAPRETPALWSRQ